MLQQSAEFESGDRRQGETRETIVLMVSQEDEIALASDPSVLDPLDLEL